MADETQDFDTVTIPELDDLTIALTSYFATSNLNGKLGKATVADFVTFITPYIQGVAASGFVPITGTVLPLSPAKSFSIVGAGTYTQTTGGNLVTTAFLNLISNGNGTTWSLVKAIDTSSFLNKVDYNYGGAFATVAAANAAISNAIGANAKNNRDAKRVDIGTIGNYIPYWWNGGTADGNLKPMYPDSVALVDFAVPVVPFLSGMFYNSTGSLATTAGYNYTQKYFAFEGMKFSNTFAGAGGAVRAVFWNAAGTVILAVPTGSTADFVAPAGTFQVAFNGQNDLYKVRVEAVFWAHQRDKALEQSLTANIGSLQTVLNSQTSQINSLNKTLDDIQTPNNPMFVDIGYFIRNYGAGGVAGRTVYPVTRASANTLTGSFTSFNTNPFSMTLRLSDGTYVFQDGLKLDNSTIVSVATLPTNIVDMQISQGDSQHLSPYGFKALGESLSKVKTKYNTRKNLMFSALAYGCTSGVKDWIQDGVTKIVMTRLPGTVTGGFIINPTLVGSCEMSAESSAQTRGKMFKQSYSISQNVAGGGISFSIPVGGYSGFTSINIGEGPLNTCGLSVIATDQNGVELYNKVIRNVDEYVNVDFNSTITQINFKISTATSDIAQWRINKIEVFKTYADDVLAFNSSTRAMFVCDSWGVHPLLVAGETGYTNPMNVVMEGLGYMPQRFGEITGAYVANYSRGGMTVKWADKWFDTFWANEITKTGLKPTHVFADFFINDTNSRQFPTGDSAYDFSATDPYAAKPASQGGIKGAVTLAEHLTYYDSLIRKIVKAGAIPVITSNPYLEGLNFGGIDTLAGQLKHDFAVK